MGMMDHIRNSMANKGKGPVQVETVAPVQVPNAPLPMKEATSHIDEKIRARINEAKQQMGEDHVEACVKAGPDEPKEQLDEITFRQASRMGRPKMHKGHLKSIGAEEDRRYVRTFKKEIEAEKAARDKWEKQAPDTFSKFRKGADLHLQKKAPPVKKEETKLNIKAIAEYLHRQACQEHLHTLDNQEKVKLGGKTQVDLKPETKPIEPKDVKAVQVKGPKLPKKEKPVQEGVVGALGKAALGLAAHKASGALLGAVGVSPTTVHNFRMLYHNARAAPERSQMKAMTKAAKAARVANAQAKLAKTKAASASAAAPAAASKSAGQSQKVYPAGFSLMGRAAKGVGRAVKGVGNKLGNKLADKIESGTHKLNVVIDRGTKRLHASANYAEASRKSTEGKKRGMASDSYKAAAAKNSNIQTKSSSEQKRAQPKFHLNTTTQPTKKFPQGKSVPNRLNRLHGGKEHIRYGEHTPGSRAGEGLQISKRKQAGGGGFHGKKIKLGSKTSTPTQQQPTPQSSSVSTKMSSRVNSGLLAKKFYQAAKDVNAGAKKQENKFGINTRFKKKVTSGRLNAATNRLNAATQNNKNESVDLHLNKVLAVVRHLNET